MKYDILDQLKKYIEETPREKVLQDWEEMKIYDEVGPTFEDFFDQQQQYHKVKEVTKPIEVSHFSNYDNLSPEFSSGFLI